MKLYEKLGVKKDVTKDEIKKAYRKLAKKLHPDAGGDKKEFSEISVAYDNLKDDAKRAHYDEYGDVKAATDPIKGQALEVLTSAINQLIEKHDDDIIYIDVVSDITKMIDGNLKDLNKERDRQIKLKKSIEAKEEIFAQRLEHKDGGRINIFMSVIRQKLSVVENNINHLNTQQEILDKCLEMLGEYSFNADEKPESNTPRKFGINHNEDYLKMREEAIEAMFRQRMGL